MPVVVASAFAAAPPSKPVPPSATPARWSCPDFLRRQLQWPLLVLGGLFVLAALLHADLWLADRLYAWEGHAWALRHAGWTRHIHLIGRDVSTAAWLMVLAAWLIASLRAGWAHLRRPLLYLLTATAVSALLVAALKHGSNVDCPWDLLRYGGARPYLGLFELSPAGLGHGRCFPAGHASGGYAWLALYFFLGTVTPRWRWAGLAVGLGLGLLFGVSQQLRGAHFLSHDLATLALCWTCAVLVYRLFYRAAPAASRIADGNAAP